MNDLYHYGILGMKWGIRRTPEQLGHPRRSKQYPRSRKAISAMSDRELQDKINRLLKERQYKEMTQSTAVKVGKNLAKVIVVAAATELAKELFKGALKSSVDKGAAYVSAFKASQAAMMKVAQLKG